MNRIKKKLMLFTVKQARKKARHPAPWKGEQLFVEREGKASVETFLYRPVNREFDKLPVMFNIHGGGFVGSDATSIDEQSARMADELSAFVVNINYTKVDQQPFPYPQREIIDVVYYFASHAEEFGLDASKFNLIGYSAGGNLCAGASILIKKEGFSLCSNVPVYPALSFRYLYGEDVLNLGDEMRGFIKEIFTGGDCDLSEAYLSPAEADISELVGLSHTEIILCGPDALYQEGMDYFGKLKKANVPCNLKVFKPSTHGFMELDLRKIPSNEEKIQREQYELCMAYLKDQMWKLWKV